MREYVKIRTTNPDGTTANITELCRTITWSGDINSVARTLTFSPIVSEVDTNLAVAPTELGGSAQFWKDDTLLMDAFSLKRTRDSLSNVIDVTGQQNFVNACFLSHCKHLFQHFCGITFSAFCRYNAKPNMSTNYRQSFI